MELRSASLLSARRFLKLPPGVEAHFPRFEQRPRLSALKSGVSGGRSGRLEACAIKVRQHVCTNSHEGARQRSRCAVRTRSALSGHGLRRERIHPPGGPPC